MSNASAVVFWFTAWTAAVCCAASTPLPIPVMPAPAELRVAAGRLAITRSATVFYSGHTDARLEQGVSRALRRWEARTGFTFPRQSATDRTAATLVIDCGGPGNAVPAPGEDESYALDVTPKQATLRAATVVGVLRGLETLGQMLANDGDGYFVPAAQVKDAPRFPWRGLLVDVCRHWQLMDVIKRTLDGMALAKLNVLHFHITDDQGFRIESKRYPRLHEMGSDGDYFTQDQIREIVAYAAARGIRVVPEIDSLGHSTSWLVGYPELGSQPEPYAPYVIERKWGIFDGTLNPTNDAVYEFLDNLFGEMATLFPDPYVNIGGGDEVSGKHWEANPRIQAFMREHNLKDNDALTAYFNRRMLPIITKHHKRMIVWDEALHPDLPKDVTVHSWRWWIDPMAHVASAHAGYSTIYSNLYYINFYQPASFLYLNDPVPADTTLTAEEQRRVLGGEATMWGEWISPETIDACIWPRTAAIAERLWSPREVRDVDDMYRRLDILGRRLEEVGLSLDRNVDPMLRRLAGDNATSGDLAALRVLADLAEPVEGGRAKNGQADYTQLTPLTGLADCLRSDSVAAREFAGLVRRSLFDGRETDPSQIREVLRQWRALSAGLRAGLASRSPRVHALIPLLERLDAACAIGEGACDILGRGTAPPPAWLAGQHAALAAAAVPHDGCELPFVPSLRLLIAAASIAPDRASLPPAEWRSRVEALASPVAVGH